MSRDRVEELIESFLARKLEGAHETASEFAAAHPEHAAALKRRLVQLDRFAPEPISVATPFEVPARFDGYEIVRELGRGGMGVVYVARQAALQREVAIKVIAGGGALSAQLRERFEREITTLARISHAGIVKVFGSGVVAGAPYVAMELVAGEPLTQRIPRAGERVERKAIDELVRIAIAVARALDHAHELGIVHRDVKPANVLINARGEPVLLDFGLARDDARESVTRSGEFVGTLAYTAPEQARGERIDRRADLYGLGATLYHLVTGSVPYSARSITDLVRKFESGPPSSATRLNPSLPRDLGVVLEHALAPDPRQRYASCADFADDLEAVLAGRAIRAERTSMPGRIVRWSRRKPAAATALLVATLAVVLLGVLARVEAMRRQSTQRADAFEAERLRVADAEQHADMLDRATALLAGQRFAAAKTILEDTYRRWPDDLDAWAMRIEAELTPTNQGRLVHAQIKPTNAVRADEVLKLAPAALRAEPSALLCAQIITAISRGEDVRNPAWTSEALPPTASDDATVRLARVVARVLGRSGRALELLRPVINLGAPDFQRSQLLAQLLRDEKQVEGLAAAATAQSLRPQSAGTAATLALCVLEHARTRPALAKGSEGTPEANSVGMDWRTIDSARELDTFEARDLALVWRCFEHALAIDPDNPAILQQYAYALGEARPDDWAERAEKMLRRALDLDPTFVVARFSLSYLLIKTGGDDPTEMVKLLEPIEAEYGHTFEHWRNLAYYREKLVSTEAALADLTRGLERIDASERYRLLGLIIEYRSQLSGPENQLAMQDEYDECFNLAPDDADGMEVLVTALTYLDKPRRAAWLDRATQIYNAGVPLGMNALKILRERGRIPPAKEPAPDAK